MISSQSNHHPDPMSPQYYSLFPTVGLQALSSLVHFFGVTVLTFFISHRVKAEDFYWRQRGLPSWPRACVLLVFLDSYLFLLAAGVLVFGIGLQTNASSCAAGIILCVVFYASSKILIYLFLTEKVYIVWGAGGPRTRCWAYLVCIASVLLYLIVVVCMFIFRINQFRPQDEACVIGLRPAASLPLLSYDLYINILLTALFLWPILRSQHSNTQLKRVATRTLTASGVALTTSTINITVLTILHGRELGWLCLASCGTDVIFNAGALFWVTGRSAGSPSGTSAGHRQVLPADKVSVSGSNIVFSTPRPSSGMLSPVKSTASPLFQMQDMSPKEREFRIHVTTTSHVETSPPVVVNPRDSQHSQ